MQLKNSSIILILLFSGIFIAGLAAFVFAQPVSQDESVDITGTVQGCGDNVIEPPEECDGTDLGGESCISKGFTGGGTLNCDSSCNFDTSLCTTAPPPSGGTSHYECSAQMCISVGGAGTNQCITNADCQCDTHGDINKDTRINIVDFSILMYFWQDINPSNPCADINKDGVVNLTDFSIMLYWWTG